MLSSIRLRLILSHLTVIVVATALSAFLLLSFLRQYFLQTLESSLLAQAQITAQTLIPGSVTAGPELKSGHPSQAAGRNGAVEQAPLASLYNTTQQRSTGNLALQSQNVGVPRGDPSDLAYLTDASLQLSSQLDTRIRILDSQGTVLVDSAGGRGTSLASDPLVAQGLRGRYASAVVTQSDNRSGAMTVALPVLKQQQVVGVVYLSQPLSDMTTVLDDVRGRLVLSAALALLISGLAGLYLAQVIARPIRQLTEAAGSVADGHLEEQVTVGGRDELGRLSQAFNEMTARLAAARRMQTDFVANVSHELRTPLAAVKGMVESLRDGAVDDLSVRDHFLQVIENETDRLTRLVNDLLVLSRADSGALELRREAVDLQQMIEDAALRLGTQASARQVRFDLPRGGPEDASGGACAWADPDRVRQVLDNVAGNAIQYSRPGGVVELCVDRPESGMVRIAVSDHGIGIPAEALPRIGQRFYRADKARSRGAGGSGLGLAIARALVEAHGGTLDIDSVEGQGTRVSFTLPAA